MSIDTRNKRLSIMNLGQPWRTTLPIPSGSFSQGDRQQLLYGYSGILWGADVDTYLSYISASGWLIVVVDGVEVVRLRNTGNGEFLNWLSAQGRDVLRYSMLQG